LSSLSLSWDWWDIIPWRALYLTKNKCSPLILCHIAFQHCWRPATILCENYVMTLVLPWQKNDKKNIHQCSSNVKLSLVGPTLFKSPLLTEIGYNAYPRLGGQGSIWMVSWFQQIGHYGDGCLGSCLLSSFPWQL
jgi:hypothetical protein